MDYTHYVLARTVHVLAVVLWIGGVAFVTTVLLPALYKAQVDEPMALFEQLEGRFSLQAKFTTLLAGISGFYMLAFTGWGRLSADGAWWLHLMIAVWAVFTAVLFVFEPLFLHRWFKRSAARNPQKTLKTVLWMHRLLLSASLVAVAGGVAGAHGLSFF
ncbi:MAG: hypothetical protein ACPG4U_15425 [Pseudomonadales bacterium]